MIPVEPTHLRPLRRVRLFGLAVVVGFVLFAGGATAQFVLPPGAVLKPPPGAVVVPAPQSSMAVRTLRPPASCYSPAGSTPTVSIQMIAPTSSAPGKELTYRIVAENTSDAAAHHVLVKATVSRSGKVDRYTPKAEVTSPEGAPAEKATVVTWKLGTLQPRAKQEQSLVVLPTGNDDISCCARVQFEHGQCVRTRIGKSELSPVTPIPPAPPSEARAAVPPRPGEGEPPLLKDRQPPASASLKLRQIPPKSAQLSPNEMFTYEYEVTNLGGATAKDVVLEATPSPGLHPFASKPSVSEPDDGPVTWKLGDIAPGATRKVEYSVAGERLGSHVNKAVVNAAGGLRDSVEHTVQIAQLELAVLITGPSQRGTMREATYRITVRNIGKIAAQELELSDDPIEEVKKKGKDGDAKAVADERPKLQAKEPEAKRLTDAVVRVRASDGGKIAGDVVRWSLGSLAPGEEKTVSVVLQAKVAGELTHLYIVRSKGIVVKKAMENIKTRFVEPGHLEIDFYRTSGPAILKFGQEVTYALRLRNGDIKENTNVDVVVSIPEGLELVELKTDILSQPKGTEIRLLKVNRLTNNHPAFLRLKATKVPKDGIATLSIKAASDSTGPDNPARLVEAIRIVE